MNIYMLFFSKLIKQLFRKEQGGKIIVLLLIFNLLALNNDTVFFSLSNRKLFRPLEI